MRLDYSLLLGSAMVTTLLVELNDSAQGVPAEQFTETEPEAVSVPLITPTLPKSTSLAMTRQLVWIAMRDWKLSLVWAAKTDEAPTNAAVAARGMRYLCMTLPFCFT